MKAQDRVTFTQALPLTGVNAGDTGIIKTAVNGSEGTPATYRVMVTSGNAAGGCDVWVPFTHLKEAGASADLIVYVDALAALEQDITSQALAAKTFNEVAAVWELIDAVQAAGVCAAGGVVEYRQAHSRVLNKRNDPELAAVLNAHLVRMVSGN